MSTELDADVWDAEHIPADPDWDDFELEIVNVVASGYLPHEIDVNAIHGFYAVETWDEVQALFTDTEPTWDGIFSPLKEKTFERAKDDFAFPPEDQLTEINSQPLTKLLKDALAAYNEYKTEFNWEFESEKYLSGDELEDAYTTIEDVADKDGLFSYEDLLDELPSRLAEAISDADSVEDIAFSSTAVNEALISENIDRLMANLPDHQWEYVERRLDNWSYEEAVDIITDAMTWEELTSELTEETWTEFTERLSDFALEYVSSELGRPCWTDEAGRSGLYIQLEGTREGDGKAATLRQSGSCVIIADSLSLVEQKHRDLMTELMDDGLIMEYGEKLFQDMQQFIRSLVQEFGEDNIGDVIERPEFTPTDETLADLRQTVVNTFREATSAGRTFHEGLNSLPDDAQAILTIADAVGSSEEQSPLSADAFERLEQADVRTEFSLATAEEEYNSWYDHELSPQNIVASGHIETEENIWLAAFSKHIDNKSIRSSTWGRPLYEPEQFPAATIVDKKNGVTEQLYDKGSVVVLGAKDPANSLAGYKRLADVVDDYMEIQGMKDGMY